MINSSHVNENLYENYEETNGNCYNEFDNIVDNVDNIKKDLTTLTLNDKIKYIIDLLENPINRTESIRINNDDIIDMLDIILSKLNEPKTTFSTQLFQTPRLFRCFQIF